MYVNKVNGYFIYVHCTLYTVHCTLYSILLHYTRTYYTVHYVNTVNGYFIYSTYTVTLLYIIKKLNTAYSDPSYLSRILINQPDPNYSFRTLKISD